MEPALPGSQTGLSSPSPRARSLKLTPPLESERGSVKGLPTPTPFASKRRIAASLLSFSVFSERKPSGVHVQQFIGDSSFQGSIPFTRCGKPVWGLTERGRRAGQLWVPLTQSRCPSFSHSLRRPPPSGRQPPRMGVASLLAKENPLPVGTLLFAEKDRLPVPWCYPLSPSQGRPVSCALRFPATVLLYLGRISFTPDRHLGRLWFACLLFSLEQVSKPFLASFRWVCFPLNHISIALPSKSKGKPLVGGSCPAGPQGWPLPSSGRSYCLKPAGDTLLFTLPGLQLWVFLAYW